MFRFLPDWFAPGKNGDRVDQVIGCVSRATNFASIAVLIFTLAAGAGATNETIRQEYFLLLIERLFDGFCIDVTSFAQRHEHAADKLLVFFRMRRIEIVECDAKCLQVLMLLLRHPGDELLWRNAFLARLDHDRCAVGVSGADVGALVTAKFLEACPDIRLDILDKVSHVNVSIRVRQSAGYHYFSDWVCHPGRRGRV